MGVKVTYTHDAYPKGHVFALIGLGELPNGEAVEFDEAALDQFQRVTGLTLKEAVAGNKSFKVESSPAKKGGDG